MTTFGAYVIKDGDAPEKCHCKHYPAGNQRESRRQNSIEILFYLFVLLCCLVKRRIKKGGNNQ